jgi:S1-C subfamily serine protease
MPRLVIALVCGVVALAIVACGGGGGDSDPTATPVEPTTGPLGLEDIAHSVVQIVALDESRSPIWTGSGTVVSEDGFILTNGHVVDDRAGEYDVLGIAVTDRTDQPPEPTYLAEIAAVDYVLDLAVIEVVSDIDGNPVEFDLPAIDLGDSDSVGIGDHLRILGFPGIGGETITLTEGAVSGFTSQREIADRAWIKTDATISGGNSGGLAVNEAGEIIGVPTIAGSSQDADPVDCRFVADTNNDTVVDENDTCVPIGGFINGLRPVALALPLIEAATSGLVYTSPFEEAPPAGAFNTEDVTFSGIVFSPDVTADDLPTDIVQLLPSGAGQVCAFWDYEGMQDGVSWEALWFVNGELNEEGSITDDIWVGGESGNWWVCTYDDAGLIDGLYEVVLSVEGDFQRSDAIYLGGDHPLVDFVIDNQSTDTICFALLSPSDAQNWGQDELGTSETIEPGESRPITVPASTYDLLLADCDANTLAEEYGLDVSEGGTYTLP